jgi:hypothetical protein
MRISPNSVYFGLLLWVMLGLGTQSLLAQAQAKRVAQPQTSAQSARQASTAQVAESANAEPATTWSLPQGTTVKDNGPRTYRMLVDYNTANTKGEIFMRQQVIGEYTRGLPNGDVTWKDVTMAQAVGPNASFGVAEKREFMEGFRYQLGADSLKPDFFKGFPPTAVFERNLVWDTGMIEDFGQKHFEQLKLNVPYHVASNDDVQMPDVGTFHNRDVVLEWVGLSERNGQKCALIKYQAFFNPVEIATGGMSLKGRSDYWGEVWVSLATKQIEYGTIYEVVVGEMKLPNQDTAQVMNIFRQATLEPVSTK